MVRTGFERFKARLYTMMFDLGLKKDYRCINSINDESPAPKSLISRILSRFFRITTYALLNLPNAVKNIYYLFLQAAIAAAKLPDNRKKSRINDELRSHFEKYLDYEYIYPSNVLLKSLEGHLFSKAEIVSPSLEIGIEDGKMSELHFNGRPFDYGAEFVYRYLRQNKGSNRYKRLISFDAAKPFPFKDGQFKTIAACHVFDHFDGIDKTFKEINRVLEPGGTLYFSAHSDGLFDSYLSYRAVKGIERVIKPIAPKFNLFSRTYASFVTYKRSVYNMYSMEAWSKLLEDSGLKIVESTYFLKGKTKHTWAHFNGIECSNGTCIINVLMKYNFLPAFFKRFLKNTAYSIFYNDFCAEAASYENRNDGPMDQADHGVNVFIAARKEKV